MPDLVLGLHHVTSLASSAKRNNAFFVQTLGLRRVKMTVNFDSPDVYHLYYGDEFGRPGTVMTYFPFPHAAPGSVGTGEAVATTFAVPPGSLAEWEERLTRAGVPGLGREERFGETRLAFSGPDGERLALVEAEDGRTPWTGTVAAEAAIRGFHSVTLCLRSAEPTAELLRLMGYRDVAEDGAIRRFERPDGNGAHFVDLETRPEAPQARQGAGSVHHIAFSVANRAAQDDVRSALVEAGMQVTPPVDRDYFWAIYFRSPGGVLFEVATNEPGFTRDEEPPHLGEALKLPRQHAHLRDQLERHLEPLA